MKKIEYAYKGIKLGILLITLITGGFLGIFLHLQEEYAKQSRNFVLKPEYLVNKANTPIEMIYKQEQIDAIFRSTNVYWDSINYPEIGAGIRPRGIGGHMNSVISKDVLEYNNIKYLDVVDNRDFSNMNLRYKQLNNAKTSFKREKTAQFITSQKMINNILLATNIQVTQTNRLAISNLIVLEHTGEYFIANTNGFTMRSLYSASLDMNIDNTYTAKNNKNE